jgi:hypothetical protein
VEPLDAEVLRAWLARIREREKRLSVETERLRHSRDLEALRAHSEQLREHSADLEAFHAALESYHKSRGMLGEWK